MLRLCDGAKERKTSYPTPKKNKHRRKVKLAVLKYSKVGKHGKISHLHYACPSDKCDTGVFMASCFDRHYCNKCCGLTASKKQRTSNCVWINKWHELKKRNKKLS